METGVRLVTNFEDYYDEYFKTGTDVLIRKQDSQVRRTEQLKSLRDEDGLTVPPFGSVRELLDRMPKKYVFNAENIFVVVCFPNRIKIKMDIMQAFEDYPDQWAYLFIPTEKTESTRFIRIGSMYFWLKYSSDHEWESHEGNVLVSGTEELPVRRDKALFYFVKNGTYSCPLCGATLSLKGGESVNCLNCSREIRVENDYIYWPFEFSSLFESHYPLGAVDFIKSEGGKWYAVNYTSAPLLKGTPIEEILSPEKVANEISEWVRAYKEKELSEMQ